MTALTERDHRVTTRGPEEDDPRAREAVPIGDQPTDVPRTDDQPLETALAAARAGDEQGFAVLWRGLHPSLLRYLTVRGDDGPEDLAADTWMHVVRGLPTFRGGLPQFRAWLFTIARHRAVDQGRARARRPQLVGGIAPEELREPSTAASAEHIVIANDATARALALVATLPPAQAEMVMLRVVAGLEVADVARLTGKRPGTVRVTVHRALRTLARDLAPEPDPDPDPDSDPGSDPGSDPDTDQAREVV